MLFVWIDRNKHFLAITYDIGAGLILFFSDPVDMLEVPTYEHATPNEYLLLIIKHIRKNHMYIYILLENSLINILLGQIQIFSYQVGEQDQTHQHCCLEKLVCALTGSIDSHIFEWHFLWKIPRKTIHLVHQYFSKSPVDNESSLLGNLFHNNRN